MTRPLHLVLASTSAWRRGLLEQLGLPVRTAAPTVDEATVVAEHPPQMARLRARAKALDVAGREPEPTRGEVVVVGADQVAWLDGESFGKPRDAADHFARLVALRGRQHALTTGVALARPGASEPFELFEETTLVRFRADLSDAELRAYVAWGEAAGCAGGYMVEQLGGWLIDDIRGDWTNVIGLPVLAVGAALRRAGWTLTQVLGPGRV